MPYFGYDNLLSPIRSAGGFGGFGGFGRFGYSAARPSGYTPPLSPEDEEGILGNILSGVTWLGETLDKPGRAVRGTLSGLSGGEWGGGLLNLVPFSDTAGITDPQEMVTGRDLLTTWGAPENRPGFQPFDDPGDAALDIAGFGAEVLLDPLILASGPMGALSKMGKFGAAGKTLRTWDDAAEQLSKIAKGTAKEGRIMGVTPATYADEIRAGERGLLALGLPGSKNKMVIGAGSEYGAKAIELMAYGKFSPIPYFREKLSKIVGEVPGGILQAQKDRDFVRLQSYLGTLNNTKPLMRQSGERLGKMFGEMAENAAAVGDNIGYDSFNSFAEHIIGQKDVYDAGIDAWTARVGQLLDDPLQRSKINADVLEDFARQSHEHLTGMMGVKDMLADHARDLGLNVGRLEDEFTTHVPRQLSKELMAVLGPNRAAGLRQGQYDATIRRRDPLRDMPGGTYAANRVSQEKWITATGSLDELDRATATRGMYDFIKVTNPGTPESIERLGKLRADVGKLTKKLDDNDEAYRDWMANAMDVDEFDPVAHQQVDEFNALNNRTAKATNDEFHELQKHYLYAKEFEPEIQGMLQRGQIEAADVKAYQKWFFDGLKEGDVFLGREIAESMAPKGDEVVKYFSNLPVETLETGLFHKSLADNWSDYVEYMSIRTSDLQSLHNVVRKSGVIDDANYGISLNHAWATANETRKAGLTQRGKYTLIRNFLDESWQKDAVKAKGVGLPKSEDLIDYSKVRGTLQRAWEREPELAQRMGLPRVEDIRWEGGAPDSVISGGTLGDEILPQLPSRSIPYPPAGPPQMRELLDGIAQQIHTIAEETPAYARRMGIESREHLLSRDIMDRAGEMIRVNPETPNVMKNYATLGSPETQNALAKLYRGFSAVWKTHATLMWPAFFSRNGIDSFHRGLVRAGSDTYTVRSFLKEHLAAQRDIAGKVKPLDQMDDLTREFYSFEAQPHFAGMIGEAATQTEDITTLRQVFQPIGDLLKSRDARDIGAYLDPTNVPGAFQDRHGIYRGLFSRGAEQPIAHGSVVVETGRKLNQLVEHVNRLATYKALRKAGKEADQAKWITDQIHYNYGRLKGGRVNTFADRLARDAIPFFSFLQNNVPYQIGQFANFPGGGSAQTLRFINVMQRDSDGYVPLWLREQSAIRVGGDDREASYLRKFGLSMEDPLSMLRFEGGIPSPRRFISRTLSQTNPLISSAIKQFTGEDLYTGRRLKDMASPTQKGFGTRLDLLDTLVMASPLSRGVSTGFALADPRKPILAKGVDFFTGLKFSTYDAEAARLNDLTQQLEGAIEEDPKARWFRVPYHTRKDEGVDPATQRQIDLLNTVRKMRKRKWARDSMAQ